MTAQKRYLPWLRGDCEDGPRPCPIVSCRYNLGLEISDKGSLKPTAWVGQNKGGPRATYHGRGWTPGRGRAPKVQDQITTEFSEVVLSYWKKQPSCALDVAEQPHTLEEIANILHMTRERVRQIEVEAMDRIRSAVKDLDGGDLRSLPSPGLY